MKKFDLPPIDNAKLQQMIQQNLKDPALRKSFEQQIKKGSVRYFAHIYD